MLAIVGGSITNIDTLEITYLQAAGATSNQVNNAWMEVFLANGATSTNWNTAANEFLIALGAPNAGLTMNWDWFWITNGGVIGGGAITDPTDIANLAMWLDGSDATTLYQNDGTQPFGIGTTPVTATGQAVGCWADKSGNDYHMNNADAGRRPGYRTAVQNGLSAVLGFATASPAYKVFSTSSVLSQDQAVTIASVVYPASANSAPVYGNSNTNNFRIEQYGDGTTSANSYIRDSTGSVFALNPSNYGLSANQITTLIDGGNIAGRLNGAAGTPVAIPGDGVTANDYTRILAGRSDLNAFDGYLCELIVYDAALTAIEIANVEAWLKAKWATP
jgi:hypothetical protein